ncbi:GRIP and coiled-coil domain-containing protein 2 [Orussus abietinus]|uniref:GRIP and coiled-coil domain-containing protein 2 n=1 Tax=Orussus abietinus TaxID=222816 RepID=UPI00062652B0|nr:GRIP and coiled-coil domain-containing protein 2 [Orussus abietinus]
MDHKDEEATAEASQTSSNANDLLIKTDNKDTLEDRYNKLRGLAIKLKKKVSVLTDQLAKSESDKSIINTEKEELQNKIIQISDNAKKIQTIQSEYDKLQDDIEKQKTENKKLVKNLETTISENLTLKESLYENEEHIQRLTSEVECLSKKNVKMTAALKRNQELIKEMQDEKRAESVIKEQQVKDYEKIKHSLSMEIEAHKATQIKLDAIQHECNSNSVLSLEVQNYEKSIEDMKMKLTDEISKRSTLEKEVNAQTKTISELNQQIIELRDACLSKTNQITILGEKNERIKQELCEVKRDILVADKKINNLLKELEVLNQDKNELMNRIEEITLTKDTLCKDFNMQKEEYTKQIKGLEIEISTLKMLVARSNEELEAIQSEFSGYKLRAQSVLRTKQNQSKETGIGGKNIVELEEELEQTRIDAAVLRDKCENYTEQLKVLTTEMTVIKEERDSAFQAEKESIEKLLAVRRELSAIMEQFRSKENKIQLVQTEHQEELEKLQNIHKSNMAALEERYRQEIFDLQLEMKQTLIQPFKDGSTTISNVPVDKHNEANFDHDSNSRLTGFHLLEREDGEGSESVDSYPSAIAHVERIRKNSLMPLDELLNSTEEYISSDSHLLSGMIDKQELELCNRRIKHLTALLADAERDVAKLTQLNEVLKEDIRRQQRSVEREQHANNFEYLKNVVFKFVTLKNGDERSRLIPVLNTILKLSPEETQKLNAVAGVSRGWIPGIPIPSWNNH